VNPVLPGLGRVLQNAPTFEKLFHQLDGWVRRRIWVAHRFQTFGVMAAGNSFPNAKLYGEYGLVFTWLD